MLTGLTFGSKVTVPKTTANKGYCFDKWEPEIPAKDSKVTADATYKAIFAKDENGNGIPDEDETKYSITYVAEGATNVPSKEENILPGIEKEVSNKIPAKTGYTFTGWITKDVTVKDGKFTMPEKDVTFTATFEVSEYEYTIEYYYDGVKAETNSTFAKYNEQVSVSEKQIAGHCLPGYKLSEVIPESKTITISTNKQNNIIKVYYIKDSFDYKVEYYLDNENGNPIATTETAKEKFKTQTNFESVSEDFGENWINAHKPNVGYQNGEVVNYIEIQANGNNVIKVVYRPQTNIPYTVKYFFNGKEDRDKKYSGTGTFGTEITAKDYSDSEWELNSTLVFTIAATENIFEVNYVKPEITVKKSADKQGNVQPGEKIKYKIKATNTGLKDGTVKISDTIPEGTILDPEGRITATGINKEITQGQLKEGIELPVSKKGEAIITFTVKVTANVNTTISNQATVLEGGTNSKTNIVENKVEKKVNVNAKSEKVTITNSNIVVILDNSGSMDNHLASNKKCNNHYTSVGHEWNGCVEVNGVWYEPLDDTRMEVAKDVTKDLVDMVKLPETATNDSSIISVIKFSTNASIVGSAETASQVGNLKNNIDTIKASGNTEMAKALKKAKEELARMSEPRQNNKNIVIFVSDGEPTDRTKGITDAANALKGIATVYAVAFDSDISILKNTIATSGKYYTTSQVASLKDIFSDVAQDISNSKKSIESTNGRIELENIDMDKEIIIKVDEEKLTDITGMIDTEKGENGENDKYYLDLTQFNPSDKIEIEYFSTK